MWQEGGWQYILGSSVAISDEKALKLPNAHGLLLLYLKASLLAPCF